ncbi:MAG: transglutaminase domain-containing protein [Myxococcaceae bacterium]
MKISALINWAHRVATKLPGRGPDTLARGPAKPDRTQLLHSMLAAPAGPRGCGQVGDYSLYFPLGAAPVAILKDERLDPKLVGWLRRVKQRFGGSTDDVGKAISIAKFTSATFPKRLDPKAAAPTDPSADLAILGEFIAAGRATCVHNALALQLALQQEGIPSRLRVGQFREECVSDGDVLQDERHLWVEAAPRGTLLLLDSARDSYRRIEDHFSSAANEPPPREFRGRLGWENTRIIYTPTHSVAGQTSRVTQDFFPEINVAMERLDRRLKEAQTAFSWSWGSR